MPIWHNARYNPDNHSTNMLVLPKRTTPLFLFAILAFPNLLWACNQQYHSNHPAASNPDSIAAQDSIKALNETTLTADTLTLVAVGDIMLGTDYPLKSYLPPNDNPDALLSPVAPYIQEADIAFGNLEGAFLDGGKPAKSCRDLSRCYLFRMPTRYAGALQRAGFDILSLANNHVGDFGTPAQNKTRALLDSLGIRHAGLLAHPTDTLTVKGVKIGFCAFAPNSGTCQLNDYNLLTRTVQNLKKNCAIVIASCHMGAEGASHTHVTKKKETFLGENRGNVYEIARILIDAGADLVLGHGPHVTRALDLYKERFIVYSMGNFCTYGRFSLSGVSGIAPLLQLRITSSGEFVDGNVIATKQISPGGTMLDPSQRVVNELIKLMQTDLPNTPLKLESSGRILRKNKKQNNEKTE